MRFDENPFKNSTASGLITNLFSVLYAFRWKSFYMPVRKRKQKGFSVSDFALLLVVFKRHHGSEGVNKWPHNLTLTWQKFCHSTFSIACIYTNNYVSENRPISMWAEDLQLFYSSLKTIVIILKQNRHHFKTIVIMTEIQSKHVQHRMHIHQ